MVQSCDHERGEESAQRTITKKRTLFQNDNKQSLLFQKKIGSGKFKQIKHSDNIRARGKIPSRGRLQREEAPPGEDRVGRGQTLLSGTRGRTPVIVWYVDTRNDHVLHTPDPSAENENERKEKTG